MCNQRWRGRAAMAAATITLLAACGQPRQLAARGDALDPHPTRERVRGDRRDDGAGESAADVAVRGWPTGWMVTEDDELLPVVDDVGRALSDARRQLIDGATGRAARSVRRAAAALDAQAQATSAIPGVADERPLGEEIEHDALVEARAALHRLADRLGRGHAPSVAELDAITTRAYRADLEHAWVGVHDEGVTVFMARPDRHLDAARRDLRAGARASAVDQLKRAIALYRVELGRVAASGDANAIADRLDALDRYAAELTSRGTVEDLDARVARLEEELAEHYVHRARADLDKGRPRDAGHAARALSVHLARIDAATDAHDDVLVASLDAIGRALASGGGEDRPVSATLDQAQARLMVLASPEHIN